jgi:hypothetical protein
MRRDLFFIEPSCNDVPKDPPWEIVLAAADVLKARGYILKSAQEDAYLFGKIRDAILDKGISCFINAIDLKEAVLPDNTAREDLVDNLRYMVRNIQANNELLLIDPYLFPKNGDADYIPYLGLVFGTAIGNISWLKIATKQDRHGPTEAAFRKMVLDKKPGIIISIKYTEVFHDRFWIADQSRGLFVGTSLNGIGKRYSLVDYLREEDVKDIYARFGALP